MDAFALEWDQKLPLMQNRRVVSVYFGGGTPSLLGPEPIAEILSRICKDLALSENPEITLEANPDHIDVNLMKAYFQAGINRISLGVQSLDPQLLERLGRTHSARQAIEAIHHTANAGIENISIDLMYDLPAQTLKSWKETLAIVGELPITHLSLYNLTIEPHTLFFKQQKAIQRLLPDEAISLQMYENAIEMLGEQQFQQYEISAFMRDDRYSRHNVGYWTARPFLGFGPSAFSYWEGRRFRNIPNLSKYSQLLQENQKPIDYEECLLEDEQRRELLVIQMRLREGVLLADFQQKRGSLDLETQASIERLRHEGFLTTDDSILRLTKRGVLFYDHIASELI